MTTLVPNETVYYLYNNKLRSGLLLQESGTEVTVFQHGEGTVTLRSNDVYGNVQSLLNNLVTEYEQHKNKDSWRKPPSVLF